MMRKGATQDECIWMCLVYRLLTTSCYAGIDYKGLHTAKTTNHPRLEIFRVVMSIAGALNRHEKPVLCSNVYMISKR